MSDANVPPAPRGAPDPEREPGWAPSEQELVDVGMRAFERVRARLDARDAPGLRRRVAELEAVLRACAAHLDPTGLPRDDSGVHDLHARIIAALAGGAGAGPARGRRGGGGW